MRIVIVNEPYNPFGIALDRMAEVTTELNERLRLRGEQVAEVFNEWFCQIAPIVSKVAETPEFKQYLALNGNRDQRRDLLIESMYGDHE